MGFFTAGYGGLIGTFHDVALFLQLKSVNFVANFHRAFGLTRRGNAGFYFLGMVGFVDKNDYPTKSPPTLA